MNDSDDIRIESDNLKGFVKKLIKKYPDIKPHNEDDWDWTWSDEGYDAMEGGDYELAQYKFEQVIVSQPDHFEGYEGLALAYHADGRKSEAIILIDHAVKLARALKKIDGIDPEALKEMLEEQLQIHDR